MADLGKESADLASPVNNLAGPAGGNDCGEQVPGAGWGAAECGPVRLTLSMDTTPDIGGACGCGEDVCRSRGGALWGRTRTLAL